MLLKATATATGEATAIPTSKTLALVASAFWAIPASASEDLTGLPNSEPVSVPEYQPFGIAGTGAPDEDSEPPPVLGIAGTGSPSEQPPSGDGEHAAPFGIAGTGRPDAGPGPAAYSHAGPAPEGEADAVPFGIAGTGAPIQEPILSCNRADDAALFVGPLELRHSSQGSATLVIAGQPLAFFRNAVQERALQLVLEGVEYVAASGVVIDTAVVAIDNLVACDEKYIPGASYVRATGVVTHVGDTTLSIGPTQALRMSFDTQVFESDLVLLHGTQPVVGGILIADQVNVL